MWMLKSVLLCDPDRSVSAAVGWFVMKRGPGVRGPLRMDCKISGDPLTLKINDDK